MRRHRFYVLYYTVDRGARPLKATVVCTVRSSPDLDWMSASGPCRVECIPFMGLAMERKQETKGGSGKEKKQNKTDKWTEMLGSQIA